MIYFFFIDDFGVNIRGYLDSILYMYYFIEKLQCFMIDSIFCMLLFEFFYLFFVDNMFEVNIVYSFFVKGIFYLKYIIILYV